MKSIKYNSSIYIQRILRLVTNLGKLKQALYKVSTYKAENKRNG